VGCLKGVFHLPCDFTRSAHHLSLSLSLHQVTTRYDLYEEELDQLRAGVVITTVAQRDGRRGEELTAATLPCEVEWGPYANTVLITLREVRAAGPPV
jgi:hypothetical protein